MIMKKIFSAVALLIFMSCRFAGPNGDTEYENNWAQWRGPYATGAIRDSDPPVEWGENKNIKWKTALPGTGHSTPVIWGDRIYLTAAVKTDQKVEPEQPEEDQGQSQWMSPVTSEYIHQFVVMAFNREDGKVLWETAVREVLPYSGTHQYGSWASNSPVTDGERIYAYFGSYGLYCLDNEGNIVWEKELGRLEKAMSFGEGSSPVLHGDRLIVLRDHQGPSSVIVLNKNDGELIWEKERDEVSSWSTPAVIEYGGGTQVVTAATNRVRSYDLRNGQLLWECGGLTGNVIPSPVYKNGVVYLMSGFRGLASMAVDLSQAKGDITGTGAILWRYDQNTPYTPSPLLMDNRLYFLKGNNGYLTCLDAGDGTAIYENRKLEGINNIFTSPVGAGDRIYITGTDGLTSVVAHGVPFRVIAQNSLEDSFYASPVVKGNELYLRGVGSLYCIAAEE